jgi:hypothetical protein
MVLTMVLTMVELAIVQLKTGKFAILNIADLSITDFGIA